MKYAANEQLRNGVRFEQYFLETYFWLLLNLYFRVFVKFNQPFKEFVHAALVAKQSIYTCAFHRFHSFYCACNKPSYLPCFNLCHVDIYLSILLFCFALHLFFFFFSARYLSKYYFQNIHCVAKIVIKHRDQKKRLNFVHQFEQSSW